MRSGNKLFAFFSLAWMMFIQVHFSFAKNEDVLKIFNEGNQFYMSQDYDQAITSYEKLVAIDKVSAEVYYNLGNAYYKSGNIAAAILNYERALRLKPSDPDIAYNLRIANLHTIDKIEPVPKVFYEKWWDDFVNEGSVSNRARIVTGLLWLALILAAIYLFSRAVVIRKIMFFGTLLVFFAALFTWYLTYSQQQQLTNKKAALIFTDSAYVKSSPDDESANLFMLHSGTRIEVLDELKGWRRIRIANGNEGWINAENIQVI